MLFENRFIIPYTAGILSFRCIFEKVGCRVTVFLGMKCVLGLSFVMLGCFVEDNQLKFRFLSVALADFTDRAAEN